MHRKEVEEEAEEIGLVVEDVLFTAPAAGRYVDKVTEMDDGVI